MHEKRSRGKRRPKPTKWQVYKRLKGIYKHVPALMEWDLLPPEVGMRILAFLQVRDLVRFCLVCKNWRDTILSSQYFKKLHSKLCPAQKYIFYHAEYDPSWESIFAPDRSYPSIEHLHIGKTAILIFHNPGLVFVTDGGLLVCISEMQDERKYEVGNPLINSWKTIPNPSDDFIPTDMIVDKLSGDYMVLAVRPESDADVLHAEVFHSRENSWRKGGTLDWDGVPHNELIGTSKVFFSQDNMRVAIYDYEQNQFNWMIFDSPLDEDRDYSVYVLKNRNRVVLVALPLTQPEIKLWSGTASNGALKWRLMTAFDMAAMTELVVRSNEGQTNNADWIFNYFHERWNPMIIQGKDDSIVIAITGGEDDCEDDFSDIRESSLLLEYDLARCFWKPFEIQYGLSFLPVHLHKEETVMFLSPTLSSV